MQNKGTVICKKCNREIKWVRILRSNATDSVYNVTVIEDGEVIVNEKGEVRCKRCDEPNIV